MEKPGEDTKEKVVETVQIMDSKPGNFGESSPPNPNLKIWNTSTDNC